MEQNQQQQQQWQGTERRQSQGHHTGDERRKSSLFDAAASKPGIGMSTQERKEGQQERTRQQATDQTDTH